MNKYKYLLIGDSRGKQLQQKEDKNDLKLAGLYQWSNVFKQYGGGGEIEPYWRKEDLEDFDIIHINYTPSNIQLPTVIRDELGHSSSTKIVINVDLDVKQWSPNFAYQITSMKYDLECADIMFHVEPHGADILSQLIDRPVQVCPHPVDVRNLYDYMNREDQDMAGVIFHRYTGESLIPYIALKDIPIRRVLFGYTPIGKSPAVANAGMYDEIRMYENYHDHIDNFSKSFIGIDLYSGYSFGRAPIEMAALGIPGVVSSTLGCAERLFPYTTVDPFDTRTARDTIKRLMTNQEFINTVIKHAHEECKYYGLEQSYERFVEMMEGHE